MKSFKGLLALPITLILSIIACNVNVRAPAASPLDAAATIVAMTLKAQGVSSAPPAATTAASSPTAPLATATTKPTVHINANSADCRSGPGPNFKLVASFSAGTTVDMIAKDTADGYWLVADPSSGSSCWVQAKDATPGGSFDLLPEVTPKASVSQKVPAKPGSSSSFNYWEYDCAARTVTLRWIDVADNENGYHIYRNGELIADLPPGSTSYLDTISSGGSLSYSIRAYNDVGESAPLNTPSFSC